MENRLLRERLFDCPQRSDLVVVGYDEPVDTTSYQGGRPFDVLLIELVSNHLPYAKIFRLEVQLPINGRPDRLEPERTFMLAAVPALWAICLKDASLLTRCRCARFPTGGRPSAPSSLCDALPLRLLIGRETVSSARLKPDLPLRSHTWSRSSPKGSPIRKSLLSDLSEFTVRNHIHRS